MFVSNFHQIVFVKCEESVAVYATDEQRRDGEKGEQWEYQSREHPTTKIAYV